MRAVLLLALLFGELAAARAQEQPRPGGFVQEPVVFCAKPGSVTPYVNAGQCAEGDETISEDEFNRRSARPRQPAQVPAAPFVTPPTQLRPASPPPSLPPPALPKIEPAPPRPLSEPAPPPRIAAPPGARAPSTARRGGCQSGRRLAGVFSRGTVIQLDNESIFEVEPPDTLNSANWKANQRITVCDDNRLINTDNGEGIDVKRVR